MKDDALYLHQQIADCDDALSCIARRKYVSDFQRRQDVLAVAEIKVRRAEFVRRLARVSKFCTTAAGP